MGVLFLLTVIAGLVMVVRPETAGIVTGLLVGINFLTSGFSLFMLGAAIRNHGVNREISRTSR